MLAACSCRAVIGKVGTLENSDHVASFAVVVDALNDRAAEFYRRYGFLPFTDDAHRLYLPMGFVKTLLG